MLEGSLNDFSLPDVLRLLAFTSKTGRLAVTVGDRRGRVDLLDGRVRDASADAARLPLARRVLGAGLVDADTLVAALDEEETLPTDLQLARRLVGTAELETSVLADLVREQTVDATFDLLRWEEGTFRFDGAEEARGPSALDLALGVDELLDEASRRLDAWPSLEERTGALAGVVSIRRPGREHAEVALPPDGWTLLGLVDGRRTLAELIDLCGQGEYRTRRAIGALVDEGVIAVGDGDGLGPGERLLRDHAVLADRERVLAPAAARAATVEDDGTTASPAAASPADAPTVAIATEADGASDHDEVTASLAERLAAGAESAAPATANADTANANADTAKADTANADTANTANTANTEVPTAAAPAAATPAAASAATAADGSVRRLRTRVRDERLRTDPSVDADLVDRLIAGVQAL